MLTSAGPALVVVLLTAGVAWRAARSVEAGARALAVAAGAAAVAAASLAAARLGAPAPPDAPTWAAALAALAWAWACVRYAALPVPPRLAAVWALVVAAATAWATWPLAPAWTDAVAEPALRVTLAATLLAPACASFGRWLLGAAADVRWLVLAAAGAAPAIALLAPGAGPVADVARAALVAGCALATLAVVEGRRAFARAPDAVRVAFDAAPEPQLLIDPLGRVSDLNPAAERWIGRTLRAARGRPLARVAPTLAASGHGHAPREGDEATFLTHGDERGTWRVDVRSLGPTVGTLWTLRDVAAERRERDALQRRAALTAAAARLARGPHGDSTLTGALRDVGGALGLAAVRLIEDDGSGEAYRTLAAWRAEPAPREAQAGRDRREAYVDDGMAPLRDAIRHGRATLVAAPNHDAPRVALPLRDDDGGWSALVLEGGEPGRLREARDGLDVVAGALAGWLARRRRDGERARAARASRQLARIERALASTEGIEAFFPLLAGLLGDADLVPLHRVGLVRLGGGRPSLALHGPSGRDPDLEAACRRSGLLDLAAGSPLAAQLTGGAPSIRTDLTDHPAWAPLLPDARAAAVFPVRQGDARWGAILVTSTERDAFGPDALAGFAQVAAALEIALLRDRDRAARERRLAALRALVATGDALQGARGRGEVVERALRTVLHATSADRAALLLLGDDGGALRVIGDLRADGDRDDLERELVDGSGREWAPLRSGRTEIVRVASLAPGDGGQGRGADRSAGAWMGTPVRNGDGRAVGVLCAEVGAGPEAASGVRFDSDDVAMLEAVAQAVGGALVRLALLGRSRRQADAYRSLWQAARASEARFRLLAEHLGDGVCLHAPDGRVTYANPAAVALFGLDGEVDGGVHLAARVAPEDVAAAAQAWSPPPAGAPVHETAYRVVRPDGGTVWVETRTQAVRDEAGEVANLVTTSRDVTDRKAAEARLLQGALYDDLTGLPNRALLRDRMRHALERARRSDTRFALLFLDLDRFKVVNDTLGHAAGDALLREIAARLATCVRAADTVARLGGDEFCVLLEAIESDDVVLRTAERIQAALTAPFALEGRDLFTSASIGVAFSRPDHVDPDAILHDADQAMYRAKAEGKARYAVHDAAHGDAGVDRLALETELHRAIEQGELRLAFQPIVELGGGRVVGVESLLRWQHPTRGLLDAGAFVPFAEETGLIVQLDRWAIDRACRQLASWTRRYPVAADWTLSVNLSPMHFALPDPAQALLDLVRPTGLAPERLRLELTESVVRQRGDAVPRALATLHDHGVSVGIADFGTGEVSIEALQRLRIGWLKLDRSLSNALDRQPARRELAAGIEALARGLGLQVVAEGVEHEADRDALGAMGFAFGQGFLWSRAVPADELVARYLEPRVDRDARA